MTLNNSNLLDVPWQPPSKSVQRNSLSLFLSMGTTVFWYHIVIFPTYFILLLNESMNPEPSTHFFLQHQHSNILNWQQYVDFHCRSLIVKTPAVQMRAVTLRSSPEAWQRDPAQSVLYCTGRTFWLPFSVRKKKCSNAEGHIQILLFAPCW